MGLSILTRPRELAWSRNVIDYMFSCSFPTAGDRVHVQLQNADTMAVLTEVSYPVDATQTFSFLRIQLQELMAPTTSFSRPSQLTPGTIAQVIEESAGNIARFKIRYRGAPPGYPISWVQDNNTQYVVRGGVGDMSRIVEGGLNASSTAMPLPGGRFLTHVPSGRQQAPDEWGWLLFLALENATLIAEYTVYYLNGSSATFTQSPALGGNLLTKYRNWYIPTGVAQAGLDPSGYGVDTITITVSKQVYVAGVGNTWVQIDSYGTRIDNRPDYNAFTLYYRNSLGGWDNLRLRGQREVSSEAERKEADLPYPFADGKTVWFDAAMRPKWKLNTGFLSKEHFAVLDDLLLSTECALLYGTDWIPVRVTNKSLAPLSTKGGLYTTEIEIEAAGSFGSLPRNLKAFR